MAWRGIPECLKHKMTKDDKLCKKCTLKPMCGTWSDIEKKRKKKEKVPFTKMVIK